ncbi:MAG: plasmid pRiA4b ORF-3 family protein [Ruminococcus sp.]|nr:plasmid pRiA4b ORF-3 family protein [Ruminococcus sp.]
MPRKTSSNNKTYVISVSLGKGCYRHLKISGGDTLDDLHYMIQEAFDFDNDHMYAFFLDNKAWSDNCYSPEDSEGKGCDSGKYSLSDILSEKQKFLYIFDFGDEWRFSCNVLRIEEGICKEPEIIRSVGESPEQYADSD